MLTLNRICLDHPSARLIAGLIVLLTVAACGGGGGGGGGGGSQLTQTGTPTVSSTFPVGGATGVATSTSVSATFSESMDNATLTNTSFTLRRTAGGAAVTGTIGISGNSATFTPSTPLAVNTQYTATITTAAKDAAGNALPTNYTWNFTTGSTLQATSYTTNFTSTENPISEGGIWTNGLADGLDWTDVKTTGGNAVATQVPTPTRYSDDIAHIKTAFKTFSANQFAQGTVYRAPGYTGGGGGHEVELLLRFSITNNIARGYEVLWGLSYIAIVRWNGPVTSYLELWSNLSFAGPANGDVLKAEIVGTTISVYKNGLLVGSATDSTFATGQPGIGFWPVDGATPGDMGWQNFTAGDL